MITISKATVALGCAALIATEASASPLEDPSVGGAVFTGVTSPHPSSLFINPSALALAGGGAHYYVGGSLRLSRVGVDRQLIDPQSGQTSRGPSVTSNVFTPAAMIAAYRTFERGLGGIAVGLPFSEQFPSGESELAYHTMGGGFRQFQLTGGGAFRIGGKFHVGAMVSLGVTQFRFQFARDTALEAGTAGVQSDCGGAPCGLENPQARQEIDVDVGTRGITGEGAFFHLPNNVGLILGMLYEIRPRSWRFGFSFVAPPGTFAELPLRGRAETVDPPRDGGARRAGEAEVSIQMPFSFHLGASGPITEDLDLVTQVRWYNASAQGAFDIRMFGPDLEAGQVPEWYPRFRGLRDTVQVVAGLERQKDMPLRWGARLVFDSGAVAPRRMTPIQVEPTNLTAAGGLQIRFLNNWVASIGYALTWYLPRSASPSAFDPRDRLACIDSMFEVDACAAAREGRATPSAAGDYNRFEHGLTAGLRWDSF